MGGGIAQVAAAAGHSVLLFDAMDGVAQKAKARLRTGFDGLISKKKIDRSTADAILQRIEVISSIEALRGARLVVEAIKEDLEVKRRLFAQLEAITGVDTILATNTSSISITAIARDAARPGQIVGMHFFNPAPVMKLVEIVSGVATDPAVAKTLFDLAMRWDKEPVFAKSTPGFIVNRVARPYYGEALRLLEEGVLDCLTIDTLMTEGGGFRMGPFKLMDLIGNDVNFAVSESVFTAYYQEPRFRPSIMQRELVNAGHLGVKTGRGFYDYTESSSAATPAATLPDSGAEQLPADFIVGRDFEVDGVEISTTDGRTARLREFQGQKPVIICDLSNSDSRSPRVGYTASPAVPANVLARFTATLHARGTAATPLPDYPGLVVMRILALIVNEAFETMLQGVASEMDLDKAMRFGVNYPRGPVEWARNIGLLRVLSVLDNLFDATRDSRYRASVALRMSTNGAWPWRPTATDTE